MIKIFHHFLMQGQYFSNSWLNFFKYVSTIFYAWFDWNGVTRSRFKFVGLSIMFLCITTEQPYYWSSIHTIFQSYATYHKRCVTTRKLSTRLTSWWHTPSPPLDNETIQLYTILSDDRSLQYTELQNDVQQSVTIFYNDTVLVGAWNKICFVIQ